MKINKLIVIISIITCCAFVFGGQAPPLCSFSWDDTGHRLTITTKIMTMKVEDAAVIYIRDNVRNEVLIDSDSTQNMPSPAFFIGFTSDLPGDTNYPRAPKISDVAYSLVSATHAQLVYSPLYSGTPSVGCSLTMDISVDTTGEIIVQLTGVETNAGYSIARIDLPVMGFAGAGAICQTTRLARADGDADIQTAGNQMSPSMAVLEGTTSCLSAWSETTKCPRGTGNQMEFARIKHHATYDHLVLETPIDLQVSTTTIVSSPWRFGTYPNWLEAARRWRVLFEARTGAKKLWENRSTWARSIHCFHSGPATSYAAINAVISNPANLLFFRDNQANIILAGDHRIQIGDGANPTSTEFSIIAAQGWPLMLGYNWLLYEIQSYAASRVASLQSAGKCPTPFTFTPDYSGSDWYNDWAPVSSDNPAPTEYATLHPGSSIVRDYLVQNFVDFCVAHGAKGAYCDVCGTDSSGYFTNQLRSGYDYLTGEKMVMQIIASDHADYQPMPEQIPTHLIPYVFITWEGYFHITNEACNHPLRTALIGSYVWAKEYPWDSDYGHPPFYEGKALTLGMLPYMALVGGYPSTPEDAALASQARSQLYCQYELYPDLPTTWNPAAIAYFRMNTGNMMRVEATGGTVYTYIEERPTGDGGDITRLTSNYYP